jgi:hypothetical protein
MHHTQYKVKTNNDKAPGDAFEMSSILIEVFLLWRSL